MLKKLIGTALKPFRAGENGLVWNNTAFAACPATLILSSTAFTAGTKIPLRHAGRGVGENMSPPLHVGNVPPATLSLVALLEDPDAPLPKPVLHFIAFNIPPAQTAIADGAFNGDGQNLGIASFGRIGYAGPRALPGHGTHHYSFAVFALDTMLSFARRPTAKAVIAAMQGHVLARGRLVGLFGED